MVKNAGETQQKGAKVMSYKVSSGNGRVAPVGDVGDRVLADIAENNEMATKVAATGIRASLTEQQAALVTQIRRKQVEWRREQQEHQRMAAKHRREMNILLDKLAKLQRQEPAIVRAGMKVVKYPREKVTRADIELRKKWGYKVPPEVKPPKRLPPFGKGRYGGAFLKFVRR
jgi:hypothetical protein